MNNRRRLRIKTWFILQDRAFRRMTDEEQQEKLDKFWETFNIPIEKGKEEFCK